MAGKFIGRGEKAADASRTFFVNDLAHVFPLIFFEGGFVIKKVHMTWASIHEKENYPLRTSAEVRLPWG